MAIKICDRFFVDAFLKYGAKKYMGNKGSSLCNS